MNPSKFDKVVESRANQRAQEKIDAFRKSVGAAIKELGVKLPGSYYDGWLPHDIKDDLALILANIASGLYFKPGVPSHDNPLKPCEWPRAIWDKEEAEVQKQLLATMDEMQRALCAPEPSFDEPQAAHPASQSTP